MVCGLYFRYVDLIVSRLDISEGFGEDYGGSLFAPRSARLDGELHEKGTWLTHLS